MRQTRRNHHRLIHQLFPIDPSLLLGFRPRSDQVSYGSIGFTPTSSLRRLPLFLFLFPYILYNIILFIYTFIYYSCIYFVSYIHTSGPQQAVVYVLHIYYWCRVVVSCLHIIKSRIIYIIRVVMYCSNARMDGVSCTMYNIISN